jgi:rhodanese-related sulfurtransferase
MHGLSREIARYILPMAEPPVPSADNQVLPEGWDGVRQLHPAVLASRLEAGDAICLVDVREPWEWELVRLDGARHVPPSALARVAAELDPGEEVVVYCHHGVRSLAAGNYLSHMGFRRVWNLAGGIERYAVEVDRTLPRY